MYLDDDLLCPSKCFLLFFLQFNQIDLPQMHLATQKSKLPTSILLFAEDCFYLNCLNKLLNFFSGATNRNESPILEENPEDIFTSSEDSEEKSSELLLIEDNNQSESKISGKKQNINTFWQFRKDCLCIKLTTVCRRPRCSPIRHRR